MMFSDKMYNTLKWLCLIALPAFNVLYAAVDAVIGIGKTGEVTTIVSALIAFIGSCIGISTASYNAKVGDKE